MKKTALASLWILVGLAVTAWGQATLPTFHSGPWYGQPLPTGWTQSGLGTDYKTDYDKDGGFAAKFDGSGDWLQIRYNSAASTVSYYAMGNGTSGEYVYKVQESVNGASWTDVVTFNSGNPLPTSAPAQYTNSLNAASRYVRFIYVTKATGNVGLDGVLVSGPSLPTITFTPNGTNSAPVSNQFSMAVAITPGGAGLKSWSMAPAYAGPATLTNGTFTFTPAATDNGKTFTVSVVASNVVGTITNTANITVSAYVPPVPVIQFSPAAPYSVMATQTQKLGIAVSPLGSGIASWTLLPAYSGTATLTGTNFSFIPATNDAPANYTLTVLATNTFGTTTGTATIAVAAYVPPPPPAAYICTFEDGSKTGYASGDVTLSNKVWNLTGILIGSDAADLKIGNKAARLKYDPTDGDDVMTIQSPVMSNGISTISLWYGPYGNHGDTAPTLAIEVSENLSSGWIEVGRVNAGAVEVLTYYSADVFINTPLYVRIRAVDGNGGRSCNFDNITITPFAIQPVSPYDAFLLKYNVTPGDPGTLPGDDYDGDGFTNQQEFDANTNPYDDAVHP
ncbi:MAG TPA: hypothetical protein PKI64_01240 [Kiritimatiellia bacterium]|nr:hypothetical protein [Kiritimatiellia bacterium]